MKFTRFHTSRSSALRALAPRTFLLEPSTLALSTFQRAAKASASPISVNSFRAFARSMKLM